MKALTGNFALLSVNLLVRCIQSILLGSVIERNFSLHSNFPHELDQAFESVDGEFLGLR